MIEYIIDRIIDWIEEKRQIQGLRQANVTIFLICYLLCIIFLYHIACISKRWELQYSKIGNNSKQCGQELGSGISTIKNTNKKKTRSQYINWYIVDRSFVLISYGLLHILKTKFQIANIISLIYIYWFLLHTLHLYILDIL